MQLLLTALLSVVLGYVLFLATTLIVSGLVIRYQVRKHREGGGLDD